MRVMHRETNRLNLKESSIGLKYYEVGDLFPWEMFSKMILYMLNVDKNETRHK